MGFIVKGNTIIKKYRIINNNLAFFKRERLSYSILNDIEIKCA